MISASRAETVLRQVAGRHRESAILQQLGPLRSERLASPVSLFAGGYFVVSRRRRCTPSDRLAGAIHSFARGWDPEEIPLLFLDTSWRRNGRVGILLTNRRLYSSRLDGPLELQDVTRATFRDPFETEMIFKGLLFVMFCLVGVVFLLGGSWFSRRLLVNGEVVYQGREDIHPDFWIDLLTALGEAARKGEERSLAGATRPGGLLTASSWDVWLEPARRRGVTALEMLPHSAAGVPLAGQFVDAPSWEHVERSIRGLDGHTQPRVRRGRGRRGRRRVGDHWRRRPVRPPRSRRRVGVLRPERGR